MSVIKQGTVSVSNGSEVVTGTGTNWLGQVAPGQVFALVGEVSYTIASVASDTSLTLTAPYGGETDSGQAYSVTRDFTTGGLPLLAPGTVSTSGVLNPVVQALEDANNARLVRENNLSDLDSPATARANLGLGSAAVQADTRYAHRANNLSDLGSATTARNNLGLGTAATADTGTDPGEVPLNSDGSGLAALNASALASGTIPDAHVSATLTAEKAYRQGNILGTVSQTGGVPTGAIIERGSNSAGRYTKYADGTGINIVKATLTVFSSNRIMTNNIPKALSLIANDNLRAIPLGSTADADYSNMSATEITNVGHPIQSFNGAETGFRYQGTLPSNASMTCRIVQIGDWY